MDDDGNDDNNVWMIEVSRGKDKGFLRLEVGAKCQPGLITCEIRG
jgi:hypothetical protein